MITVKEANHIIQTQTLDLGTEEIDLINSLDRILKEDLVADRDFPPYDRVTMDGIAINGSKYIENQRIFNIQEMCAAGDPKCSLVDSKDCIEIMTGSILPDNTDTIIRYEDLKSENRKVTIEEITFKVGQNVHRKGSDHKKGSILVRSGVVISSAEIGIAASIGKSKVLVQKLPKIAVISSGDELVDIEEKPLEHQIRKSNVIQMQQSLKACGFEAKAFHIIDNFNMICDKLEQILTEYDVLILSGGVSKGKKDFIPEALEKIGVNKKFHRVAQRPGKPFWFGMRKDNKYVFALPGNPVSSFMCLHKYVIPWLRLCQDQKQNNNSYVELTEGVDFKPDLTYFVPVKLEFDSDGKVRGIPSLGNGSGDFANLVVGDGFVELPKGQNKYEKGTAYKFIPYR